MERYIPYPMPTAGLYAIVDHHTGAIVSVNLPQLEALALAQRLNTPAWAQQQLDQQPARQLAR
jgi:hypothetical protein